MLPYEAGLPGEWSGSVAVAESYYCGIGNAMVGCVDSDGAPVVSYALATEFSRLAGKGVTAESEGDPRGPVSSEEHSSEVSKSAPWVNHAGSVRSYAYSYGPGGANA